MPCLSSIFVLNRPFTPKRFPYICLYVDMIPLASIVRGLLATLATFGIHKAFINDRLDYEVTSACVLRR